MTVARTWVFPIIRIVIFLAIAAALIKIAFFAEPVASETPAFPTGEITEPLVPVTVGTVKNDVAVKATVFADPAVPVKATLAGDVLKLLVAAGQPVAPDTPVMTLRAETLGTPNAEGVIGPSKIKTVTVLAGSAGVVSSVAVIVGQTVAIGDAVAQVAPTTFSVSGTLAPEQQYRLLTKPTEAQVTITGGPAPFTCTALTITTPLAGAALADPMGGEPGSGGGTGATAKCAVPPEVTVFAGLAASMSLAGGIAENVLTVPVTAVEGSAGTGNVYIMGDDGTPTPMPVTLGINDGTSVVITGGVVEGDMVLQFVPGAVQSGGVDMGDGCMSFPDGSVVCGPGPGKVG